MKVEDGIRGEGKGRTFFPVLLILIVLFRLLILCFLGNLSSGKLGEENPNFPAKKRLLRKVGPWKTW